MRSSTNNNNFNEDNQRGTQSPGVQDEELPDIEVPCQVPPPPIRFVPLRGHVGSLAHFSQKFVGTTRIPPATPNPQNLK